MLESGARRLGAAFQKVNFLRDLAADSDGLGRAYFPGVDVTPPRRADEAARSSTTSTRIWRPPQPALPLLARGPAAGGRPGARALRRARGPHPRTPAETLRTTRIRVPDPAKARLAALAVAGRLPRRR